jgi:hypothetical protein
MESFCRSSSALAAVLVLAGCATTPEPKAVATPHLGQEVTFMAADTDQSGNLTAEEVVLHHHQELLAGYDQDRDQQISEAEWKARNPGQAETDPRFVAADTNKDKKLSKAEVATWVSQNVSFGKSFKKYDTDGNGRLYWKEVDAMAPTELRVTIFSLPLG